MVMTLATAVFLWSSTTWSTRTTLDCRGHMHAPIQNELSRHRSCLCSAVSDVFCCAGSKKTIEGTVGGVAFTLAAWAVLLLACGCWKGRAKGGFLGLPLSGGDSLSWTGTPRRDPYPAAAIESRIKALSAACVFGKRLRVPKRSWSPRASMHNSCPAAGCTPYHVTDAFFVLSRPGRGTGVLPLAPES